MSMMVFQRGRKFSYKDRILVYDTALNYREVVLIDPASAEKIIAPVSELRPPTPIKAASEEEFTEAELVEAQRRYEIIEPMLMTLKDGSALYRQIAEKEAISVSTLFRWRERYLATGSITSLLDKPKGRKKGAKALDPVIEAIVDEIIDEKHMSQDRWGPVSVLRDVKAVMLERGVAKRYPCVNTIANRINEIDERKRRAAQDGENAAEQEFTPNISRLVADFPLEVVMCDHTLLKVMVVSDDEKRLPLGPAWITVVFDVFSRMVLGTYITLEAPSAQSVGEAVVNAILPKDAMLAQRGITDLEWPVWGMPLCIHADNSRDFRSNTLKKSCIQHRINIHWRPVKKPNWGGHIEAYMKNLGRMFKEMPGAMLKNYQERPDYDPEKSAAMTLREIEEYVLRRIVGVYIQEVHSGLKMSPLAKWQQGLFNPEKGLPLGLPARVADEETLRWDFRPRYERTIGPDGVRIRNVTYYDPILAMLVNEREPGRPRLKKKFIIRADDHNVKFIRFWDDKQKRYHPISASNIEMPNTSRWELEAAARACKEKHGKVDEGVVVRTLLRTRQLVQNSVDATRAARRQQARIKRAEQSAPKRSTAPRTKLPSSIDPDAPSSVQPFKDVGSL